MSKVICYYDFEATSVSRASDPISLGIIAVQNNKVLKSIYCEFTDFSLDKCADWVKENVVSKLQLNNINGVQHGISPDTYEEKRRNVKGNTSLIGLELKQWLSQFEEIEFWADYDVIDKPMLIDLIVNWDYNIGCKNELCSGESCTMFNDCERFKYKVGLPKHLPNIKYDQFFDLHTLFKIKGIDTDISRKDFVGITEDLVPFEMQDIRSLDSHNALYDAYVSWLCYNKLMNI